MNVDLLKDRLNPVLYKLRANITAFIEQGEGKDEYADQISILKDEILLIDDVAAAPSRPLTKNYEQVSTTNKDDTKVHGITLKH